LLLAVATDAAGPPAAFCQFVPATRIGGYSLDLMRRSREPHPNGLMDFVVVRTIEHLAQCGRRALSLNLATMRAVVAGDVSDGVATRVQRQLLRWLSSDMQIESLWRFSAKFDPAWRPRFVVLEGPELALSAGLAIARAESFWELPIIGRSLRPTSKAA
jgi:lysyl-tRNA synthetase class 2